MSDSVVNTVIGTGNSFVVGCVKFFDKNAGFGFISVLNNNEFPQFSEKDIFVHYSGIHIENQQYKYLVKGEYVQFKIQPSTKGNNTNDNKEFNAVEITGIQGGKLMCETNYSEYIPKSNRPQYVEQNQIDDSLDVDVPIMVRRPTMYQSRVQSVMPIQYQQRENRRTNGPPARAIRQPSLRK